MTREEAKKELKRMMDMDNRVFCPDMTGYCTRECICFTEGYIHGIGGEYFAQAPVCSKYNREIYKFMEE